MRQLSHAELWEDFHFWLFFVRLKWSDWKCGLKFPRNFNRDITSNRFIKLLAITRYTKSSETIMILEQTQSTHFHSGLIPPWLANEAFHLNKYQFASTIVFHHEADFPAFPRWRWPRAKTSNPAPFYLFPGVPFRPTTTTRLRNP